MKIFKQLNKKGYKHYYEGTVEELDSMDKNNQHLHSEIMQVIMWLYEKHGIWIWATKDTNIKWSNDYFNYHILSLKGTVESDIGGTKPNSPTEAYESAIEHCLTNLI